MPPANSSNLRSAYPEMRPFASGRLRVGGAHELYFEQCGDVMASPIVVLHGGPGAGCTPAMRRFFNPERWHVVLFDQRGCGRSTPRASLEDNTTWALVDDMERLRRHIGLERWSLFGGSWGSTLAMAYAQAYPERVDSIILRGVFLMTPTEIEWFYGGGAGALLPEAWDRFLSHLSPDERSDPLLGYYERLTSSAPGVRPAAARTWTAWEGAAITGRAPMTPARGMRTRSENGAMDALARLECHYCLHGGFLQRPDQLLAGAKALAGIPGVIVQGRFDLVTPPVTAWRLAQVWPTAALNIVPEAGHAASDPRIVDALVRATDALATEVA